MIALTLEYGLQSVDISTIAASADEAREMTLIVHRGEYKFIDPEQLWFWSDEWQEGERRVDEYIRAGNIQLFDTIADFLGSLRE